jgi:hypothetical protein
MKKSRLFLAAMLAGISSATIAQAQTARLEVIHNSADAGAAVVDIYVNGGTDPFIDDFAFRTSSGFVDVPAGVDLNIGIAPASSNEMGGNGAGDILFTLPPVNLTSGETYIAIANGIVSQSGYSPAPAFGLDVYPTAREAAAGGAGTNDVLVYHGSTDAPMVDVDELNHAAAQVVNDLSYGEFQGYLPLGVLDYTLQIQAAANGAAVAAYDAPLQTLGVDGAALTVLASGFFDPSQNSNGEDFGLWVSTGMAGPLLELPRSEARLEVIHSSADAAAAVVDVFVNGEEFIPDFEYRTSSGFVTVPGGMPLSIQVAPDGAGIGGALPAIDIPFLKSGEAYIAIANGAFSGNYNPVQPFELHVFEGAREAAQGGAGTNDVLVYHGATDAPMVDVVELAELGGGLAVNDLSYAGFQDYIALGVADYTLQVQAAANGAAVAAFDAPLATLGVDGAALTVIASGFLNPSNNENGEAFGLFASTGMAGPLLELPRPEARLEVIHNSADAAAAVVDVFVNGDELIPDFAYRTSSGFVTVPAGMPLSIQVAPDGAGIGGALPAIDIPFLKSNETYIAVANGAFSGNYMPIQPFELHVFEGARETAEGGAGTNDVLVYHGSTDAPMVDVDELEVVAGQAVDDLSYGEFQGYLSLGVEDYTLQIQAAANGAAVAAYDAPLATLGVGGAALTVIASGFLNPSMNENGEAFGLWVSTGAAGALLELPRPEARLEIIHNSADAAASIVDVFVNGTELVPDFEFRTSTGFITVDAGMPLTIDVAPDGAGIGGSVGPIDIPFLSSGKTYIAIANGIVSGSGYMPAPAFGLDIYDEAREEAANQGANETDVLVYHGSTDAPIVDVAETGVGAGTIVDDIAYSEFQGYLELGTLNYQLTIQDETGAVNVATFDAPLQTLMLEDAAITVLASGFLDPTMNSNGAGFGLWVSLGTGGDLIPLSNVTGVEEVEAISNAGLFPNPTNDNATMFFDLVEDESIQLEVVNTMGQSVLERSFGQMLSGNHRVEIPASELAPGFYFVNLRTNTGVVSTKLQVVR